MLQFTDIASSVYKSPWYERDMEDRKILLFVMMKGQRHSYFTAGGFVEINVNTYGSVRTYLFYLYIAPTHCGIGGKSSII